MFSQAIEGEVVDEAVVCHERDDAFTADAVGGPADRLHVRIRESVLVCGAGALRVSRGYASNKHLIFAILVVIVLVQLPSVVRRGADDDEDTNLRLALNALSILRRHEGQRRLPALGQLERVNEADTGERLIPAGQFKILVFDVL